MTSPKDDHRTWLLTRAATWSKPNCPALSGALSRLPEVFRCDPRVTVV